MKTVAVILAVIFIVSAVEDFGSNYILFHRTVKTIGNITKTPFAEDRIAFGYTVPENSNVFKYQVRIDSAVTGRPGAVIGCGGSLIHERYVLTAGHCLKGSFYDENSRRRVDYNSDHSDIYFGIKNLDHRTLASTLHMQSTPDMYIIHSGWNPPRRKRDDIALIRLPRAVNEQTDNVAIIPLPSYSFCQENHLGSPTTISGWGEDENSTKVMKLKAAEVLIRTNKTCIDTFGSEFKPVYHICAGGSSKENTCEGDSGGPMIINDVDNNAILYGVTSYGGKKCNDGSAGVYSRVCKYASWIANKVNPRRLFEWRGGNFRRL